MINYCIGFLFIIVYSLFLLLLGKSINFFKYKSSGFHFIIGYVFFTFMHSIGGLIVQLCQLKWEVFYWYSIFIILLSLVFIFIRNKNDKLKKINIKEVITTYWFVFVILSILVVMSVFNISASWLGNNLDDGRYLNFISLFPKMDNPYTTNLATGLFEAPNLVRSLTTFELENAFWVDFLNIEPTLYVRLFLTIFNYMLILVGIYEFAKKVLYEQLNIIKEQKYIQYVLVFVLFFGIYEPMLSKLLFMQDGWQFSSAIWYGSSIVRIPAMFICLSPLLHEDKLCKVGFSYALVVSYVMITRAGQALPFLVILVVAFFSYDFIFNKYKCSRLFLPIILVVLLVIPYIEVDADIKSSMHIILSSMSKQPLAMIAFLFFILGYLFKNKFINRWNSIIIIMLLLVFVPRVNNLFLDFAMYNFVGGRTITLLTFTIVATSVMYFAAFVVKYTRNRRILPSGSVFLLVIFFSGYCITYSQNYGFSKTISILKDNPLLFPQETIDLSEYFENCSIAENKKVSVLTPTLVNFDGYNHPISVMLRIKSDNLISVSAIPRYWDNVENSPFTSFDQNCLDDFNNFNLEPLENVEKITDLINLYPIDYCVFSNEEAAHLVEEKGYGVIEEESKKYDNIYIVKILR